MRHVVRDESPRCASSELTASRPCALALHALLVGVGAELLGEVLDMRRATDADGALNDSRMGTVADVF
jgi:hypothetical protein